MVTKATTDGAGLKCAMDYEAGILLQEKKCIFVEAGGAKQSRCSLYPVKYGAEVVYILNRSVERKRQLLADYINGLAG